MAADNSACIRIDKVGGTGTWVVNAGVSIPVSGSFGTSGMRPIDARISGNRSSTGAGGCSAEERSGIERCPVVFTVSADMVITPGCDGGRSTGKPGRQKRTFSPFLSVSTLWILTMDSMVATFASTPAITRRNPPDCGKFGNLGYSNPRDAPPAALARRICCQQTHGKFDLRA